VNESYDYENSFSISKNTSKILKK